MKLVRRFNQGGGIAESIDTSLNNLGTLGKLMVEAIDPTGITGWKDLKDSLKSFQEEKSTGKSIVKAGQLGLDILAAMPVIGIMGKAGKLGKIKDIADLAKIEKSEKLVSKSEKLFDYDTYKLILDSSEPIATWMIRNFTPRQKEEAVKLIDKEIDKIVDWCKTKNIIKVPKKLENKIIDYATKRNDLLSQDTNISRLLSTINWELRGFT